MRTGSILLILAAAGSLLGACHKARERPAETETANTSLAEQPMPERPRDATIEPAPKPATIEPTAPPEPVPAPKPTADEQMIDDADATGMTSHAARDGESSDAVGNNQP